MEPQLNTRSIVDKIKLDFKNQNMQPEEERSLLLEFG